MDAVNQYFEVFKKWTELQVKTGQGWIEAVQKTDKFDPGLLLGKTVDASQASIQGTLDAEVEGAEIWFKSVVSLPGMPEEMANLVEPMQGVTKQVIGMQQTVVDNWFGFLKGIDFFELPTVFGKAESAPLVIEA